MKKTIVLTLFILSLMCTLLSACRETPLIGDLAGRWQILYVEYPQAEGYEPGKEPQWRKYAYSFYRHTAQSFAIGNLTLGDGWLTIEYPGVNPMTNQGAMKIFGVIPSPDWKNEKGFTQYYTIVKLTGEQLILSTPQGTVIYMRKF